MTDSNSKIGLIILSIFLSVVFLLHYFVVKQAVYGDGIYYFALTRSLYFYHNINIDNELSHHYSYESNNSATENEKEFVKDKTVTGFALTKYPIGPSIAWLPGMFFADIFANIIKLINVDFPNNGYSNIYQIFIGLLNVSFVSLAIFLLYKFIRQFFNPFVSFMSIATITLGSLLFL